MPIERGICVHPNCGSLRASAGKGQYRLTCHSHKANELRKNPHKGHKGSYCRQCGPDVIYHPCQLDVDHIDGDKKNTDLSNFQTLCANCHRLKTFLSGDFTPGC